MRLGIDTWLLILGIVEMAKKTRILKPFRTLRSERLEDRRLLTAYALHPIDVSEASTLELRSADLNGDGDADVVSTSGYLWWKENLGQSTGTFSRPMPIGSRDQEINSVVLYDVDLDGDMDIAGTHENEIFWIENTDGKAGFAQRKTVYRSDSEIRRVDLGDINADQKTDIVFYQDGPLWLMNVDGSSWQSPVPLSGAAHSASRFVDLNGDGAPEQLLDNSRGAITGWRWNNGDGSFDETDHSLGGLWPGGFGQVTDYDDDGDFDFLTLGQVFLNDGKGTFAEGPVIDAQAEAHDFVLFEVLDLNDDGQKDLVLWHAKRSGDPLDTITYALNDGTNAFPEIQTLKQGPFFVAWTLDDFNDDGHVDAVTSDFYTGNIFHDQLRVKTPLASEGGTFSDFKLTDVDGDGDLDVLVSSWGIGRFQVATARVIWYENHGNLEFGPASDLVRTQDHFESLYPLHVDIGDMNGDGRGDLIWSNRQIMNWQPRIDGEEMFGDVVAFDSSPENRFSFRTAGIHVIDHDEDGDLDIIRAKNSFDWPPAESVDLLRNDGSGRFEATVVASDISIANDPEWSHLLPVAAAFGDLDGDGDLDRVSGPGLTVGEARPAGDSNNDGQFDSDDLVAVFAIGEYEDRILGNSTFDEGDWNGDGDFDSRDFVFAFQANTYVRDAGVAAIAAAIDNSIQDSEAERRRGARGDSHGRDPLFEFAFVP